jgi:hypothetical protein
LVMTLLSCISNTIKILQAIQVLARLFCEEAAGERALVLTGFFIDGGVGYISVGDCKHHECVDSELLELSDS